MRSHRLQFLCIIIQVLTCNEGLAQHKSLFELQPSSRTGVNFKNIITESAQHNALTFENLYNGGGVAIGDINNDGLDDIYLVSNMEYNKLYLNLGNFRFKDITSSAGVAGRKGWKTGVTMVDINGDRLLDIYACYSGKEDPEKRRNQFFINKGDLTFEERAQELNLDDPSYSTQAAFFDYDKDGDLDVFLLATNVRPIRELEFQAARKQVHPYAGDKLFRNDNGYFTNVTTEAGILSNALGFGLGVAVSDINKDGWPDLYISNDYIEPDYLYINNGNGTFSDKLKESIQHISHFSMGSDISDVNNDAWPDIYTVDMLPEDNYRQKLLHGPDNYEHYNLSVKEGFHHQYMRNMLHISNADGTFSEVGQLAGVSNTDWSWAALFADYDNDGWKDLFVTNGYFRDYTNRDFLKYKGDYYFKKAIAREKPDTLELVKSMTSTPLHNYIFRNNGDLTFTDKSSDWGFTRKDFSNGVAYGDLDNDGDLDLVINHQNERASVYKNNLRELDAEANYIKVQLGGEGKNTFGIGSKLYIWCENRIQYLELMPTRGYQSSVSYSLHAGIGKVKEVDSLKIVWPSGRVSILKGIKANQAMRIDEKDAQAEAPLKPLPSTFFSKADPPVRCKPAAYVANDFKRQPMLMQMLSNCGPVIATADVNGDALVDIYISGVKGNPGKLFIQNASSNFDESPAFQTSDAYLSSEADAIFFDADNDRDQDLYLAAGGYHDYKSDDVALQDRLYLNDGAGNFSFAPGALPVMRASKSCVRAADIDHDGDQDLFVGGRVIPGAYPVAPESYLLINEGSGHFVNKMSSFMPAMIRGGMITDASWLDLNKDGFPDLMVVGEFMPVRIFINNKGTVFEEASHAYFEHPDMGLWNKLAVADFDHDGDADVIAGNMGLNSQLKACGSEPLELVYDDFDNNGSVDPVLTYFVQHKPYPFPGRDEMLDQVYALRKKFTSYEVYANAQLPAILSGGELEKAKMLRANELKTAYFENKSGRFEKHILPLEAQYAPVTAIEVTDVNHDGNLDFILAGNQHATRIRLGAIDANYGQLFLGDGKNNFQYVPQKTSGLALTGDVKSLRSVTIGNQEYLLAGINNNGIVAYKK